MSEHLLSIYLDEYPETPWDALKYLVREQLALLCSQCGLHIAVAVPESDPVLRRCSGILENYIL